jgi:SAM-dependent methyltransferase
LAETLVNTTPGTFGDVDLNAQRLSFGAAADLYDRVRPRYPVAAVQWMTGPEPLKVVDLGAGTGILTRQLLELGHDVIPVEPDAGMRAQLDESVGRPLAQEGSAEAIALPDASVDAVVAGQAYHWFDHARAHPEIARVLRPGGVFAPVWNMRDERIPWVRRLTEITDAGDAPDRTEPDREGFGPLFSPVDAATFEFSRPCDRGLLLELMRSRSYYLAGSPERRAQIDRDVQALADEQPPRFELPYVTHAYRARRL